MHDWNRNRLIYFYLNLSFQFYNCKVPIGPPIVYLSFKLQGGSAYDTFYKKHAFLAN